MGFSPAQDYAPWETYGQGAFVSTYEHDAENRLIISCLPEEYWYIYPYHSIVIMLDDNGNSPDIGWTKTVKYAVITVRQKNYVEVFKFDAEPKKYSEIDDEISITLPNTKMMTKLDPQNKRFVNSLAKASTITVSVVGDKTYTTTFSGKGSAKAISDTYCAI